MFILSKLEPRHFEANTFILNEDSYVYEIIFVETGKYSVGFNQNFENKEIKIFGRGTAIGDWEAYFNHTSEFNYKCKNRIEGYCFKKEDILDL